jgi:hypothetical protein
VLERSLLLTLATHTPVVPLMLIYIVAVAANEMKIHWQGLDLRLTLMAVSMIWATIVGVEVARKIRLPAQETAYQTYSQIWGPSGAVVAALLAQSWALAVGLMLYRELFLSWLFAATMLCGYAVVCASYGRFLIKRTAPTARLQPYAEVYVFLVLLGAIIEWSIAP